MWKNPKVWSLAIAETITWAGIFYLFPAMLMHWETYFGWSRVELTFGFTGALIISAGTGIFAGRLIDRGHGRTLMTVSAFTGGLLIAMLPLLQHLWQFYLIWLLIGFTMAGCLYEPCFAFLTHVTYIGKQRCGFFQSWSVGLRFRCSGTARLQHLLRNILHQLLVRLLSRQLLPHYCGLRPFGA